MEQEQIANYKKLQFKIKQIKMRITVSTTSQTLLQLLTAQNPSYIAVIEAAKAEISSNVYNIELGIVESPAGVVRVSKMTGANNTDTKPLTEKSKVILTSDLSNIHLIANVNTEIYIQGW